MFPNELYQPGKILLRLSNYFCAGFLIRWGYRAIYFSTVAKRRSMVFIKLIIKSNSIYDIITIKFYI